MSGGHFGYIQELMETVASDIEELIRTNDSTKRDEWGETEGRQFSDETIAELHTASDIVKRAAIYTQRIDWLVSGDDGEDTFHQRLSDELEALENE